MLAKIPDGLTIAVPAGDQGGPMTNGANHAGAIHLGDLDTWTFPAAQDDYITLSVGEPDFGEVDPGFYPWMRLVGPNGAIIGNDFNTRVAQVSINAPLSGTYTVIIGTGDAARVGTGSYLPDAREIPDAILNIPVNDQGGPLTNGANHAGSIHMGDLDQWTFQANQGDYIAVSAGEPPFGEIDPGFYPWMRVIGPNGVLLGNNFNTRVAQVNIVAPLTGKYTVIIGTGDAGRLGTGNYIVTLAKAPGVPITSAGDQGGPLTNGSIHSGSIFMGDLDYWTFQANKDDYLALSVGEPPFGEVDPGFYPWIRLVSPTGALIGNDFGARVGQIAITAPLTGTYGVIIGTGDSARVGLGTYNLTLATVPGDYTFTAGDEGGPMTNTANHTGTIDVGDMDEWWFVAAKNHLVSLTVNEPPFGEIDPGFSPWIRVIGPTGALVASSFGTNSAAINFSPTLTGRYTVLVANALTGGGSGNYVLQGSGINAVQPFTVTPSVSGGNGTISPSTAVEVQPGGTISFTLTPNSGFIVASVGGTCGGTLAGLVCTTAAINADCTVVASFSSKPTMTLANTALQFGAVTAGSTVVFQTGAQTVALTQVGPGTVSWTATPSQPWLKVSPTSGTGSAPLTISVTSFAGMVTNTTVTGSIAFTFDGAGNNPGPITVKFVLKDRGDNPFGSVDTPTNNRTGVTGAIPFTGWILDDVDVVRVMICRAAFGAEVAPVDPNCGGAAQIFVGFGLFIEGARPDVAAAFPQYPANTRAGWGFMVLTNMLPNQGNGTYVFQIYGQDRDGHTLPIGTRTLTCSNATATLPFGAIDTAHAGWHRVWLELREFRLGARAEPEAHSARRLDNHGSR